MQNEKTNTQNQNAQKQNPQNRDFQGQSNQNQRDQNQKVGESAAINKLDENEDENADDTCGCGSSHETGSSGQKAQQQNDRRPTEVNQGGDETNIPSRVAPGKRMGDPVQNDLGQPRSQRQLGDPDDQESTETRRRESAAEDAEKSGDEAPTSVSQGNPSSQK